MIQHITSPQNKTFKSAKMLLQKKYREKERKFLLEGLRYIVTALEKGHVCHGVFADDEAAVAELDTEALNVYVLGRDMFRALSGTEHSQGVIGLFAMTEDAGIEGVEGDVLFLDRVSDPGNLGTMIRTADAAGIVDLVLAKGSVDCYNDKVLRSAAGSILNVRCHYVEDACDAVDALKAKGYRLVVTALREAVPYDAPEVFGALNCLVIGNEASGVSEALINRADVVAKIPIFGEAESLNAAVAAGIMMYKMKASAISDCAEA